MNAPVDVLAVLEEMAAAIWQADYSDPMLPLADEAHAAVAELIEAAQDAAFVQINRRTPANDLGRAKQLRLRAALARVKGGA